MWVVRSRRCLYLESFTEQCLAPHKTAARSGEPSSRVFDEGEAIGEIILVVQSSFYRARAQPISVRSPAVPGPCASERTLGHFEPAARVCFPPCSCCVLKLSSFTSSVAANPPDLRSFASCERAWLFPFSDRSANPHGPPVLIPCCVHLL